MVRFLPDGRVDRGFGHRGVVYDRFAENLQEIGSIAPTSQGRFLVVGTGTGRAQNHESLLALRFDAGGQLDTSFGERGMLPLSGPGGGRSSGEAALAQPDGSVVVAGWGRSHSSEHPRDPRDDSQLLMLARLR